MDELTLTALLNVAAQTRKFFDILGANLPIADVLHARDEARQALAAYDAAQAAADAALIEETVPEAWGCPQCGERRMDNLNWDANGEMVTCAACGEMYAIAAQPVAPIPPAEVNIDAEAQRDYLAMVGRGLGLHRATYR